MQGFLSFTKEHNVFVCVERCVCRGRWGEEEGGRKKVKTFPVKFIILFYVTCINYEWETKRARERHSRGKCWLSIIPIIHTQPCTHVLSQANKRNASVLSFTRNFFSLSSGGRWHVRVTFLEKVNALVDGSKINVLLCLVRLKNSWNFSFKFIPS